MKRYLFAPFCSGLVVWLTLATQPAKADQPGAVYTMDNAANGNHVLVFKRHPNGTLTGGPAYETGGTGTGTGPGLPSQGPLALSRDGRWLFVCNAGSSDISVFAVGPHGLALSDKVNSGGVMPLSLTLHHNLLYVLNAGGLAGDTDNITGFLFAHGKLMPLPDSTRSLSGDNTGPAQVSFTRDGNELIVAERVTGLIDTFLVGDDGLASDVQSFPSAGATPFGFDVGRQDRIFVSEAAGGAPDASSASSYQISQDGMLSAISPAVPTTETAACWLVASHDGRFVYTANAGSGSISGFRIGNDGMLHLLDADGRTGLTGDGSHPADMAFSRGGRFLYSLNNGNGTISVFRVRENGSLDSVSVVAGIPTSASGLVAR